MYGVSKITMAENIMLVSFSGSTARFMSSILQKLADAGVIVDMISQTPPSGGKLRFSFTASFNYFSNTMKAIGEEKEGGGKAPMISGGYSKINLYGEEMVGSVGVAAKALAALSGAGVDVAMITTSDLDISLLVRQEEEDVACETLKRAYKL